MKHPRNINIHRPIPVGTPIIKLRCSSIGDRVVSSSVGGVGDVKTSDAVVFKNKTGCNNCLHYNIN